MEQTKKSTFKQLFYLKKHDPKKNGNRAASVEKLSGEMVDMLAQEDMFREVGIESTGIAEYPETADELCKRKAPTTTTDRLLYLHTDRKWKANTNR